MNTVSVNDFLDHHGVTPDLRKGQWRMWKKEGTYGLKGRDLQVKPHIWDPKSGTAWVTMPNGQAMLVRVENLIRYKTGLTDPHEPQVRKPKPRVKLPTSAEELLRELELL